MADYFEHMRRLASRQGGYAYDWVSDLAPGNGEDAYTALVLEHLTPGAVVLEAGCGHGPDIPGFAPKCARYIAYDAVDEFIAIARKGCAAHPNVELITANSSARHNNGRARIPADDASLDLIISRRGPGNWIADARRACKPGAVLIQLNPGEWRAPAWAESLPGDLRREEAPGIETEVRARLEAAGVCLHSAWTFDVPEILSGARELYRHLTWLRDEPPSFEALGPRLQAVLDRHGGAVDVRQKRFLWKAVIN
ncbi:MAG: class I SAM-dependent methyltransferase [Caulobacteraceae bacterium]